MEIPWLAWPIRCTAWTRDSYLNKIRTLLAREKDWVNTISACPSRHLSSYSPVRVTSPSIEKMYDTLLKGNSADARLTRFLPVPLL
jgi:hypothetical protein